MTGAWNRVAPLEHGCLPDAGAFTFATLTNISVSANQGAARR